MTEYLHVYEEPGASTCFLVMGLPRSGTSMVSGILYNLGMYVGDDFTPPDLYNESGYYENIRYATFHALATGTPNFTEMILAIHDVINKEKIYTLHVATSMTYAYLSLVYRDSAANYRWAIKDPRMALPYIMEEFIKLTVPLVNVKIITVRRDAMEVTKSLGRVTFNRINEDDFENLADDIRDFQSNLRQRIIDTELEFLPLTYNELLVNPKESVSKIAEFCEVDVTDEAVDFINPSLRNFK